jgi:hypothetical protein
MAQAATQKQIDYLLSLGAEEEQIKDLSIITASAMIKRLLKAKKENTIKEKKQEFEHGYKVGDILYMSWGYEQTNLDFFQVVATTAKTIRIIEVSMKIKEQSGCGSMSRDVAFNTETAQPLTKSYWIKDQEKGDIKKICSYEYNGQKNQYVAVKDHHLYKYTGQKLYESWYA